MSNLGAPSLVIRQTNTAPVTLAADSDTVVCRAPFTGSITGCVYIAAAAFTGSSTARTFSLINKGAAGAGALVAATLPMTAGVNLVAFVAKPITVSGTAANVAVTAGDVIEWNSLHVSTGVADPGGLVEVTFSRADTL